MWSIILLLGICSLHWTTGIDVQRGNYNLQISAISGHSKSLLHARCISSPQNGDPSCTTARLLDMSGLGLQNILFRALHHLISVENLDLSNNELNKLPRQIFSQMKNLRTLSLANNEISWLNLNLSELNHLERLDLSNNHIKVLKSRNLFDIPKSVEIIFEGNNLQLLRIKQDELQSKPILPVFPIAFLPREMSFISGITTTISKKSPSSILSLNYSEIKSSEGALCKDKNGIVTSLHLRQGKMPWHKNCLPIVIDIESHSLYLSHFGLTAFRPRWYGMSDIYFSALYLAENNIRGITPELLNDLPDSIGHVSLTRNSIRIIRRNIIVNKFIESLWLNGNHITVIEDDAFKNTNLHELDLSRNHLQNLDFARSLPTSIKTLRLGYNIIRNIAEDSLINLINLEYLSLKMNSLTHLSAGTFRGLNSLRNISISFNKLKTIEPGTFHQENLFHLDLADNKIVELKDGAFKNLKKISRINISFNKIKKISRNTFSGMRDSIITRLNLDINEIDTIEEGSFAHMTIRSLSLKHNNISTDSIAKGAFNSCKLVHLHLDRNLFTSINGDSFYGIQIYNTLSLQDTGIKTIRKGDVKYMGCPLTILFNGNRVRYIENGAFYDFKKCQYMAIRFEEVKLIEAGVFDYFDNTPHVVEY